MGKTKLQICVQLQSYNLVGITETWMECCNEGMQALWEGPDGKTRKRSCPLCERAAGVRGALLGDG